MNKKIIVAVLIIFLIPKESKNMFDKLKENKENFLFASGVIFPCIAGYSVLRQKNIYNSHSKSIKDKKSNKKKRSNWFKSSLVSISSSVLLLSYLFIKKDREINKQNILPLSAVTLMGIRALSFSESYRHKKIYRNPCSQTKKYEDVDSKWMSVFEIKKEYSKIKKEYMNFIFKECLF